MDTASYRPLGYDNPLLFDMAVKAKQEDTPYTHAHMVILLNMIEEAKLEDEESEQVLIPRQCGKPEALAKEIADRESTQDVINIMGLFEEDAFVGFAVMVYETDVICCSFIYVLPEWRNLGVAKGFLKSFYKDKPGIVRIPSNDTKRIDAYVDAGFTLIHDENNLTAGDMHVYVRTHAVKSF